jgi:hypothetical protein
MVVGAIHESPLQKNILCNLDKVGYVLSSEKYPISLCFTRSDVGYLPVIPNKNLHANAIIVIDARKKKL